MARFNPQDVAQRLTAARVLPPTRALADVAEDNDAFVRALAARVEALEAANTTASEINADLEARVVSLEAALAGDPDAIPNDDEESDGP